MSNAYKGKNAVAKKIRKPSDYPQFTFRLSASVKERLAKLVSTTTDFCNKDLPPGEYMFRKNEIIIEALERGLKDIKKNPPQKKS